MRVIISDKAGNILRTVIVPDHEHAYLQLGTDGASLHVVPPEAGHIDDGKLELRSGVLTRKKGIAGDIQHHGLKLEAPKVELQSGSTRDSERVLRPRGNAQERIGAILARLGLGG